MHIIIINPANANIKNILHNLFYDVLNIDFNLWPWTRNMCKYGDFYLKLDIAEKRLPTAEAEKVTLQAFIDEKDFGKKQLEELMVMQKILE